MKVGPFTLRDNQQTTISNLRTSIKQGNRLILLVAPCGFGKTVLMCAIAMMLKPGHRLMIIVDRRQLAFQASEKLNACQMPHAVLMADCDSGIEDYTYAQCYSRFLPENDCRVLVVSKQTYESRVDKGWLEELNVDMVIEDEAHEHLSESWEKLRESHGRVWVGLTATPIRGNGRAL